jgi:glutamine synthetase
MGRRKLSLSEEKSTVLSVRVPRSWVKALRTLETEEIKQQMLVRRAIRLYLQKKKALE